MKIVAQQKSCAVLLNRNNGYPLMGPNPETGEFNLYNPEIANFVVGNLDHKSLRINEAAQYRFASDLSCLALVIAHSTMGQVSFNNQHPVNNWVNALVTSGPEIRDGVYEYTGPARKAEGFSHQDPKKLMERVVESKFISPPTMGWITASESVVDKSSAKSIPVKRFRALLKSRLMGLLRPHPKLSVKEREKVNARNLKIVDKFGLMLDFVAGGASEATIAGYHVQFGEEFQEIGIPGLQEVLNGIQPIVEATQYESEDVCVHYIPSHLGHKPTDPGWITPVIMGSPIWVWNGPSPFANHRGFIKEVTQEQIEAIFAPQ